MLALVLPLPVLAQSDRLILAQVTRAAGQVLDPADDLDAFATRARRQASYMPSQSLAERNTMVHRLGGLAVWIAALEGERTVEGRILALHLRGRVAWAARDTARADAAFAAAEEAARAAGFGDRDIALLLADRAALALASGDRAGAAAFHARALTCGAAPCDRDLLVRRGADGSPPPALSRAEEDAAARALLDALGLEDADDIFRTNLAFRSHDLEETRPMEAADYAERAYYLTGGTDSEAAIHAAWLALKANRFARVAAVAAHHLERVEEAVMDPLRRLELRRVMARARLRGGDRTAAADYTLLAELAAVLIADPASDDFEARLTLAGMVVADAMDTTNIAAARDLLEAVMVHENTLANWSRRARLQHRAGDSLAAAETIRALRRLDWLEDGQRAIYVIQEAAYRRAAGERQVADALDSTLPARFYTVPATGAPLPIEFSLWPTAVLSVMAERDAGNHEGAAFAAAGLLPLVPTLEARGEYRDAQILWQIAYTLARGGRPQAAFPIMARAAAIAARLSFADPTGPEGGTLQLLQRDNIRYLLFIDIAWAAARGRTPEEMLVFSRY